MPKEIAFKNGKQGMNDGLCACVFQPNGRGSVETIADLTKTQHFTGVMNLSPSAAAALWKNVHTA